MTRLTESYMRDQQVWDACATTYETRIVQGHPDVLAYEAFEEDLLDRILLYLVREQGTKIHLYDVGCGSGRLHLRYGMKTADMANLPPQDAEKVRCLRLFRSDYAFDHCLAERLHSIGGLDFSVKMLETAEEKLRNSGLADLIGIRLLLEQGSAFELQPMNAEPLPIAVSVCNSVGVMQGPDGAAELFKSMRRAVEDGGGIAIISGYRREAVENFALGNYESTMDVCGQPRWVAPDTYAKAQYQQVPHYYKRAHDSDQSVIVDVFDREGKLVKAGHVLQRDPDAVRHTIITGHIRTHTDYESRWYSFEQFDNWIAEHWSGCTAYHLAGAQIDALRGEPAQFAILDIQGLIGRLLERWGLHLKGTKD